MLNKLLQLLDVILDCEQPRGVLGYVCDGSTSPTASLVVHDYWVAHRRNFLDRHHVVARKPWPAMNCDDRRAVLEVELFRLVDIVCHFEALDLKLSWRLCLRVIWLNHVFIVNHHRAVNFQFFDWLWLGCGFLLCLCIFHVKRVLDIFH